MRWHPVRAARRHRQAARGNRAVQGVQARPHHHRRQALQMVWPTCDAWPRRWRWPTERLRPRAVLWCGLLLRVGRTEDRPWLVRPSACVRCLTSAGWSGRPRRTRRTAWPRGQRTATRRVGAPTSWLTTGSTCTPTTWTRTCPGWLPNRP